MIDAARETWAWRCSNCEMLIPNRDVFQLGNCQVHYDYLADRPCGPVEMVWVQ